MNVTIIGTGFVGVVTAAVLADQGNSVYGLDIDPDKVTSLEKGQVPFYEPDLEELLKSGLKSKKLKFTTSYQDAIAQAEVIMIAVGTPSAEDGTADLTYVLASAKSMAPHLQDGAIVVLKSTVPPGTNSLVEQEIAKNTKVDFSVASMPEFLKEGSAVADTQNPDRIIIGSTDDEVVKTLSELHKPFKAPIIVMKPSSAQMSKYAANAYLATRITFINQIADICEQNGADIQEVIHGMGYDKRIGDHYWYPGFGYGGSCFPKDVKELSAYAKKQGLDSNLTITVDQLNQDRANKLLTSWSKQISGFEDKNVAVLGLSFKPNTDDIREAPSLRLVPWLHQAGAKVSGYDPKANRAAAKALKDLEVKDTWQEAVKDADVTILLIEWPEIVNIDLVELAELMRGTKVIDVRNQFESDELAAVGLEYIGVGR